MELRNRSLVPSEARDPYSNDKLKVRMFKDAKTAKQVSGMMLEISSQLEQSVVEIKQTCTAEEFEEYRRSVAKILTQILITVLNRLYSQHPALKPPGFN